MVEALTAFAGFVLIAVALVDAFETIVLPRRVTRTVRVSGLVFGGLWAILEGLGRLIGRGRREAFLSYYGPFSLILLVVVWAAMLVLGFGLVIWGLGSEVTPSGSEADFWYSLYFSGSTFFTLGLGDVRPDSTFSRILTVVEAGAGFAFLALIVTYLPVLYQAFSRREVNVSLLDARAGSPPTAGEFFRRMNLRGDSEMLVGLLKEWEFWAAELMETHLSYPVLTTYRSQHERQSWLSALTFVLDVSGAVLAGGPKTARAQARLTFALARHAAVDLNQMVGLEPWREADRLSTADFQRLMAMGGALTEGLDPRALARLRRTYEGYVTALAESLLMPLPPWLPSQGAKDAWESTKWES